MGGDELALANESPPVTISRDSQINNLYQGFRKVSHDKLLLTNIVVSVDVGQFTCRYG
mgnify:CR=1 FL=1